jgi:hypothetical protein
MLTEYSLGKLAARYHEGAFGLEEYRLQRQRLIDAVVRGEIRLVFRLYDRDADLNARSLRRQREIPSYTAILAAATSLLAVAILLWLLWTNI